jgi:hypothetical protein
MRWRGYFFTGVEDNLEHRESGVRRPVDICSR